MSNNPVSSINKNNEGSNKKVLFFLVAIPVILVFVISSFAGCSAKRRFNFNPSSSTEVGENNIIASNSVGPSSPIMSSTTPLERPKSKWAKQLSIMCFSGNTVIFKGEAKVIYRLANNNLQLFDEISARWVEVTGSCVIIEN